MDDLPQFQCKSTICLFLMPKLAANILPKYMEEKIYQYRYTESPAFHIQRRREMLKKYPEIRQLIGHYPASFAWIVLLVAAQLSIASLIGLNHLHWAILLLLSYLVGAFFNHALYALLHDCAHNLIFKKTANNKLAGMLIDLALVFPSSIGFRRYHLIHHTNMGEFEYDADLCAEWEGRLVGNSWWRKSLWLALFSFSQGVLRPLRLKKIKLWDAWMVASLALNLSFNLTLWALTGPLSVVYLFLSTFFALGLHPLGGRWIQEHFLINPGSEQETYSYYGPLNYLMFNIGYHNEHHDFFSVPWAHLPKIKKIAPEYYETLISYPSWSRVLMRFIFDTRNTAFSRIVRPSR